MIFGLDTSFLVQLEVREQAGHRLAHSLKERLLETPVSFALAPQTLCEFIHIVTDPKRFENPLSMEEAVRRSGIWWNLKEVRNIHSTERAIPRFHEWLLLYRLGRKRLLDTMLAACFEDHGVTHVISSDPAGFGVFGTFKVVDPLLVDTWPMDL